MLRRRIFLVFLIIATLFVIRVPFLHNELVGEEGIFAFLIANPVRSSQLTSNGMPQALITNLDGTYGFGPFQHTVVPYILLERGLGSVVRCFNVMSRPGVERIFIVRTAYLSLFLVGVAGLAWLVTRPLERAGIREVLPVLSVALYFLSTPLAVGGSTQLQIDGGFGVLIVGISAALILPNPQKTMPIWRYVMAGALVGLGRTEWALAFAGMALGVLGLGIFTHARSHVAKLCLGLLAGLSFGVGVSVAASPEEYVSSFYIAERVINHGSQWALAVRQAIYVIPIVALLTAIILSIIPRFGALVKEAPGVLIIAGAGATIFMGFALSGFSGDGFPRYYAPALALCTYSATWLMVFRAPDWPLPVRAFVAILAMAGLFWNFSYLIEAHNAEASIASAPGFSLAKLSQTYADAAAQAKSNDVLTMQQSGIWLTHPDTRFMGFDMGYPGAVSYLQNYYPDWVKRLAPAE